MSNITMQDIVKSLESFKRHLGRRHDADMRDNPHRARLTARQYNAVERQIQWLCYNFNVKRVTKVYFLEEK